MGPWEWGRGGGDGRKNNEEVNSARLKRKSVHKAGTQDAGKPHSKSAAG